jgi:hypothetical protein
MLELGLHQQDLHPMYNVKSLGTCTYDIEFVPSYVLTFDMESVPIDCDAAETMRRSILPGSHSLAVRKLW